MTNRSPSSPDACPGALRAHPAADGGLVRLRLPGGAVRSPAIRALADLCERHGDGAVHLTARANLQLRGVAVDGAETDPALVQGVRAAGLLPSLSHELVRNVVASAWSGLRGGLVDVRPLVGALDSALCADAGLALLPGRFLMALDDGTGDVAGIGADLCWWALDAGSGALLIGGIDCGLRVPVGAAPEALLMAARAFQRIRTTRAGGSAWRVGELDGQGTAVRAELRSASPASWRRKRTLCRAPEAVAGLPRLGVLAQRDGRSLVAALVPLGRLPAPALRLLADAADVGSGPGSGQVLLTPWREVVVPDVPRCEADAVLGLVRSAGLEPDTGSGWRGVSACAGRPGCARALDDVRARARAEVSYRSPGLPPVHYSGCERRCGRPQAPHREVVATERGIEVADVHPGEGARQD